VDVIVELKEVVQAGKLLDPLLVWKDNVSGALVVFDGHHRMDAYQAAEAKPTLKVWTQQLTMWIQRKKCVNFPTILTPEYIFICLRQRNKKPHGGLLLRVKQ
jgi:hypothetical protein